jgi:uncharacterized protein (DUF2225 family)
MTTMMPQELKCPCCAASFQTQVLMSTNYVGTYTDFRRRTSGFEPSQFTVHSCPKCGFSGPDAWFKQALPENIRKFVNENLTPLTKDEQTPPWRKFEYAAQIARWKSSAPDEIADLYLRAAYVCAADGYPEEEKFNRAQAIEFFRRSIEAGRIPAEQVPNVTYLIGELYRRIGLADDSETWLEKAESLAKGRSGLDWLVKLSRQQRTDPQDMINLRD